MSMGNIFFLYLNRQKFIYIKGMFCSLSKKSHILIAVDYIRSYAEMSERIIPSSTSEYYKQIKHYKRLSIG